MTPVYGLPSLEHYSQSKDIDFAVSVDSSALHHEVRRFGDPDIGERVSVNPSKSLPYTITVIDMQYLWLFTL